MLRKKLLVSAATVVALAAISGGAQANHSWSIYHWATISTPMPIEVVQSITADWQLAFDDSMTDWNKSSVLDMPVTVGSSSNRVRKRCKAIAGKIVVCNASYGGTGWLGIASINLDGSSHITQGTAKMNDFYSSYWQNPDERYSVMCQEIGHVFGLNHTSTDGSDDNTCMDYSDDTSADKPNAHDYAQLVDMYSHDDGYNSYSTGDGGDTGGTCNAPPGKGCNKNDSNALGLPGNAIRVHGNDKFEVWVNSDNRGGHWIHHVLLAPQD